MSVKRKVRHQRPRFPCHQQLRSNCVWNSIKKKKQDGRLCKVKADEEKTWGEEGEQERRVTKRERERAKRKVSKSAWPRKIHEAKNSICHFICDGRSEALCHMTYPSYRTRRDTSIHLFRHLTCLERGTERKTQSAGKDLRRGEDRRGEALKLLRTAFFGGSGPQRHTWYKFYAISLHFWYKCACTEQQIERVCVLHAADN